eukprot:1187011-Prorocentrum_minimum.AAC.9
MRESATFVWCASADSTDSAASDATSGDRKMGRKSSRIWKILEARSATKLSKRGTQDTRIASFEFYCG